MKLSTRAFGIAGCVLVLTSATAVAQDKGVNTQRNHTSTAPANLIPGQSPLRAEVGGSWPQAFYTFQGKAGRSYCVEVTTYETELNSVDPKVTVYAASGAVIASNDDIFDEPDALFQSRACFVAPSTVGNFVDIKVENFAASSFTYYYYVRVVDTTLFNSWFYADPNYFSYSLLRNSTNVAVSVTITWRALNGGVYATSSQVIPPNGAIGPEVGTYVAVGGALSGTVEVAHNGSPDAISGVQTSLSAPAGITFDAGFSQRRSW